MGYANSSFYKPGRWNAICDVCGFQFKSDEMKKRWDGLMVCKEDFEHDHPQKFLRVREDSSSVPWVRDKPADQFTSLCYIWGSSAFAGLAEAGCSRAGDDVPTYTVLLELKGA